MPKRGRLSVSDTETLQVYAVKAQDYANLTSSSAAENPCLIDFIALLPKGADVLDLGCGPGASAAAMAQAGLQVTAFDPVPEMVALAKQHQGVDVRLAGFEDLSGFGLYDGIWANFSLLHASRDDIPKHLSRIAEALKVGGVFHIAVKTGTGSQRDGLGRLYTYFTETELRGLLEKAGFDVEKQYEGCDAGLSGEDAHWIALTARG